MEQLTLRSFAQKIRPAAAHFGKFSVVPPRDLETSQPSQQTARPPHQNTLQRNVVFMHSSDVVPTTGRILKSRC